MWARFFAAISNSIIGDTISNFVYVANTSISQIDNAVKDIYVVLRSLPLAACIDGTITNFVDKLISCYDLYFKPSEPFYKCENLSFFFHFLFFY